MPLINCEVSLILTWSREFAITSIKRTMIKIHEEILLQQTQYLK